MKGLKDKEEGIKLYFEEITISYLFLILFTLFNGLFEFRNDNKRMYLGYIFEFIFLLMSILCYLLGIKGSLSLSRKLNKKVLLTNFIVYPTYIIFTFIYNYIYHLFNKGGNMVIGMDMNFLYFIIYNIFLIYMIMFNFKYQGKFNPDYKKKDINVVNELVIGINKKEYTLDEYLKMDRIYKIIKHSYLFIFSFIGFGILINQIIKNDIALIIWISLNILWFIILIIIFIIKNHKVRMFNYKFFILFGVYFIFIGAYFISTSFIFTLVNIITRSEFAILFSLMIGIVGLFLRYLLNIIYPYFKLFFKLNIKELEDTEIIEN